MAAETRQGGDSYFALGRQPDEDTLITDPTQIWRVKRQFVSFNVDGDTEFLQSGAIRGGIDHVKGQAGRSSGGGPIETELYLRHMTPYVQAALNADPATPSVDIPETVVFDGEATPAGDVNGVTKLSTGLAGEGKDLEIVQPTTPGRLLITLAGGEGQIKVEGRRKTGLGSYDMESISETKTLDADGTALLDKSFHRIDRIILPNTGQTIGTAADLDIVAKPGLKSTTYTPQRGVFPGWTMPAVVGGVPRLGFGVVPRNLSFDFSSMRVTMETIARAVWDERNLEGGAFMQKLVDDSDLADDEFIPNTFFPYYGAYFKINDEFTIVKGFTLNIDQGLDYGEGSTGSPTPAHPERGDRDREFGCSFRVNYEASDDADEDVLKWKEMYRTSQTVKLEASAYYWTQEGQEVLHRITIAEFQITEQPSNPVENRGDLEVNITGRAIVESAANVISWEVVDEDGWIDSQDDATLAVTWSTDSASVDDEVIATITADRRVTGLAIDDLSVDSSAVLGNAVSKVSDKIYTVPVTMPSTGSGTVTLTIAEDAVGEGNAETTGTIDYS